MVLSMLVKARLNQHLAGQIWKHDISSFERECNYGHGLIASVSQKKSNGKNCLIGISDSAKLEYQRLQRAMKHSSFLTPCTLGPLAQAFAFCSARAACHEDCRRAIDCRIARVCNPTTVRHAELSSISFHRERQHFGMTELWSSSILHETIPCLSALHRTSVLCRIHDAFPVISLPIYISLQLCIYVCCVVTGSLHTYLLCRSLHCKHRHGIHSARNVWAFIKL